MDRIIECAGGCGKTVDLPEGMSIEHTPFARFDSYGIYTGQYCDCCYERNYPYRKDDYFDPSYAGESLEDY